MLEAPMVGNIKPEPPQKPPQLETLEQCPLCEARFLDKAPAQPDPPFGIMQCSKCGMIFLSPRPPVDAMRTYYDEYYEERDTKKNPRQAKRAARHFRRLSRYHSKPGKLLEVGAGDGYFLNAARNAGWQVEGLELSAPRVQRAKEWFGLDLKSVDLMSADLPRNSYDAVAMFQLIEHVHDPLGIFRRVHDLLQPGGVLLLSTPNVLAYARKSRDVNSWRIPRHLFFFTPKTLVRNVERLGFEVLRPSLKFHATLEERLGWQPWDSAKRFARITRDLWTPFGLHLAARKKTLF